MRSCCIHDFLTAIRSAKWFPDERIPINRSMGPLGWGGAFHFWDISRCFWGVKLGCAEGREAASIVWTSMSPFKAKPVASSNANPYVNRRTAFVTWDKTVLIRQYKTCLGKTLLNKLSRTILNNLRWEHSCLLHEHRNIFLYFFCLITISVYV